MPEPATDATADPPAAPNLSATDAKREAILTAALQLMSERTFYGCAVPLVAERAGVATGTIYRYFPSKEALANAVYQRWKGELGRQLLADVDLAATGGDPRQLFHLWWAGLSRFVSEHPVAFNFLELHHHEPYLDEASRALALEIDAAAVMTIEQGQRDGQIRSGNPAVLVALAYGSFAGLVRARQSFGDFLGPDALVEAEDAVWAMLAAPPDG